MPGAVAGETRAALMTHVQRYRLQACAPSAVDDTEPDVSGPLPTHARQF